MSRGKFIPGGSRKDREAPAPAKSKAPAPAEAAAGSEEAAPAAGAAVPEPAPGKGGKGAGGKGGKGRPPGKPMDANKKYIYGAGIALVVLYLGYAMFIAPGQKAAHDAEVKQIAEAKKLKDEQEKARLEKEKNDKLEADRQKKIEDSKAGPFVVETTPAGASVTVGTETKTTPATFEGVISGDIEVKIVLAKYAPVTKTVKLEPKKDLKLPITLQPLPGVLEIGTGTQGAEYILTGPGDYKHEGKAPATVDKLLPGEYSLVYKHRGWVLPAKKVVIESEATSKAEATFPYSSIRLTINPADGAIIRDKTGVQILAKDFTGPFELKEVRPGTFEFLVERFGSKLEKVSVTVAEGQQLEKTVDLTKSNDFTTSFGMQMVWVPAINGWAGRYEVTQKEYKAVMGGANPSSNKRSENLPVDSVGYTNAVEFCEKATRMEAGKLQGGRFTLPSRKQFDALVAGTDLDNSVSAKVTRPAPFATTQEVGTFGPNPQGLYDVIGNVNEWISDSDPKSGDMGFFRGGNYLTGDNLSLSVEGSFWRANLKVAPDDNGKRPPFNGDKYLGFRVIVVK